MEDIQPKTGKYALNFGLLLGGAYVLFALMLFSMEMHYEQSFAIQGVNIALAAVAIALGIVQFKKANQGYLKISEALKIGAGTALVAGIIGLVYFFLLSNVIEPDFMDKMYEIGKQKALVDNPKLTEEQIDKSIAMQKDFAWITYPIMLLMQIIIGLVIGLITGLIAKKQKPDY